jgi:hypothetical protein
MDICGVDIRLDQYQISSQRIKNSLELIFKYGQVDGSHHKAWVIDQVTRILTEHQYDEFVSEYGGYGEFEWDTGVAP